MASMASKITLNGQHANLIMKFRYVQISLTILSISKLEDQIERTVKMIPKVTSLRHIYIFDDGSFDFLLYVTMMCFVIKAIKGSCT